MNLLRIATLVPALAALPLHAQTSEPPACRHGPADETAVVITSAVAAHPTRVASVMDTVLEETGYDVLRAPDGAGQWQIAPRVTWRPGEKELARGVDEHPGVDLSVATAVQGDSTRLRIGARVRCRTPGRGAKAEELTAIEAMAAVEVTSAFVERMDTLRARGVALGEPVERPGISLAVPDSLGEFAFQARHDYDDPRLGTNARYSRADGFYVDVYAFPGPPADSSCPQTCADAHVEAEAKGFGDVLPELIRRGHFRSASVTSNEAVQRPAGAAWRAGRHVTAQVDQGGEARETHFYLFVYPGYQLKVRATFAPSAERRQAVQALVDDALVKFAPRS